MQAGSGPLLSPALARRREATGRRVGHGPLVLAAYTAWRDSQAAGVVGNHRPNGASNTSINIGFSAIALFDGFVIVSAIDLGAPIWLVLAIAIAGVLVGRTAIERPK